VQVVLQASSPRFSRWIDRLQILVQFAVLQVIDWPDGSSTSATVLPRLQHATKLQTSSNPSLDTVPGGFAHKLLSVVRGRHVDCAAPGIVRRPRKKIIRTGMMSIVFDEEGASNLRSEPRWYSERANIIGLRL
jgi:hypothetical protein